MRLSCGRMSRVGLAVLAMTFLAGCGDEHKGTGHKGTEHKVTLRTIQIGEGVEMELILIPAGEFMMGSPDGERGRRDNERPQHRVRISKPFYMGKYEVTQAQWQAVMGGNPSAFKGDGRLPVETVSWDDCQEFCKKLSKKTGCAVRLPTEAEWEYACRAGTTARYGVGDSESDLGQYAWYGDTSGEKTHAVGGKEPNAWGLYDMQGNVFEWCQDWYGANYYKESPASDPTGPSSGTHRVLRGGSWHGGAIICRVAYRHDISPDYRYDGIGGLRLALDAE